MLISYKWLLDYLPVEVDSKELTSILTAIGLEVEEVHTYQSNATTFDKVVVGKIKLIEPIEGASKIRLAKVQLDDSEQLTNIVCGAPNIVEGARVAVATPGAKLVLSSGDTIVIKKAKIRGVHSWGMICASEELGLNIQHEEGVWLLGGDAPKVGTPLSEYVNVYNDVLFKINLMPNRGDAMSYLGIARDVCAYWTYHTGKVHQHLIPSIAPIVEELDKPACGMEVYVKDKAECPRYSGISVESITIGDTPSWMQQRLKAVGVNTINNIVDISNYVMHETGQPLHIFDRDKIASSKIYVHTGSSQPFLCLDEKERRLHTQDIVISDAEKPMCIAGVFGGINSGVQETTSKLFIESACFNSQLIRTTSMRHQLRTEAALHYEKGTDVGGTIFALSRAVGLLIEHAQAQVVHQLIDVCGADLALREFEFEFAYAEKLAGTTYRLDKVKQLLVALGFEVQEKGKGIWRLQVPSYRLDITCPADVVEEIIRIDGLDNIPIPNKTTLCATTKPPSAASKLENYFSEHLCGMGFFEALHNSITQLSQYTDGDQANAISLLNSLSVEHDALRPSMMESGLASILYNVNRKRGDVKLFEFGKVYHKEEKQFIEQRKCSFWVVGDWQSASWKAPALQTTFYHLAGLLNTLFLFSGGNEKSISRTQEIQKRYAQAASFYDGKTKWGFAGQLDSHFLKKVGIKQTVWYAEVDMDYLTLLYEAKKITYTPVSKFPDVVRDVAFFISKDVAYEKIVQSIYALNISLLHKVALFDLYDTIKERKQEKSIALRLTCRSYQKTLEDSDIKKVFGNVIKLLETQWKASVRSAAE